MNSNLTLTKHAPCLATMGNFSPVSVPLSAGLRNSVLPNNSAFLQALALLSIPAPDPILPCQSREKRGRDGDEN